MILTWLLFDDEKCRLGIDGSWFPLLFCSFIFDLSRVPPLKTQLIKKLGLGSWGWARLGSWGWVGAGTGLGPGLFWTCGVVQELNCGEGISEHVFTIIAILREWNVNCQIYVQKRYDHDYPNWYYINILHDQCDNLTLNTTN